MGCRKYINGCLLAFVGLFLALFVGMIFDSDTDISMKVFCAIMAALNAAFAWLLGRQVFGKSTSTEPVQQNTGTALPISPEMDHADDMSVQYNPYFSDVYEEQMQAQHQKMEQQQQLIQQQLEQQQLLQKQIIEQQRIARELEEKIAQQQDIDQQLAQQAIDRQKVSQPMGPAGDPEDL